MQQQTGEIENDDTNRILLSVLGLNDAQSLPTSNVYQLFLQKALSNAGLPQSEGLSPMQSLEGILSALRPICEVDYARAYQVLLASQEEQRKLSSTNNIQFQFQQQDEINSKARSLAVASVQQPMSIMPQSISSNPFFENPNQIHPSSNDNTMHINPSHVNGLLSGRATSQDYANIYDTLRLVNLQQQAGRLNFIGISSQIPNPSSMMTPASLGSFHTSAADPVSSVASAMKPPEHASLAKFPLLQSTKTEFTKNEKSKDNENSYASSIAPSLHASFLSNTQNLRLFPLSLLQLDGTTVTARQSDSNGYATTTPDVVSISKRKSPQLSDRSSAMKCRCINETFDTSDEPNKKKIKHDCIPKANSDKILATAMFPLPGIKRKNDFKLSPTFFNSFRQRWEEIGAKTPQIQKKIFLRSMGRVDGPIQCSSTKHSPV